MEAKKNESSAGDLRERERIRNPILKSSDFNK